MVTSVQPDCLPEQPQPDLQLAEQPRSVAVIDIDGVVADVAHRLHHIEAGARRWNAFFAAAGADTVLEPGRNLVLELAEKHRIIWLTGRPQRLRNTTVNWLRQYQLPHDELVMRPDRDYRPAVQFKLDELRGLSSHPIAVFVDDDELVVHAARAAGFPALFADWAPRRAALTRAQEKLGRT